MDHHETTQKIQSGISVVIPTLNEEENIENLIKRLDASLTGDKYELIFIDDHSTDSTVKLINKLKKRYPVVAHLKEGKIGKAFSLIEGFKLARYEYVAMIDADLQYPPEAIPSMIDTIKYGQADVVVANRHPIKPSVLRTFFSRIFRRVFGRMLWKLDVDVQSGLKVFKRELIECLPLKPKHPWAFDLEFLLCAQSGGHVLGSYDIDFMNRKAGTTKVRLFSTSKQLFTSAVHLRFFPPYHVPFHEEVRRKEGHGFHYRSQKYITHTTLPVTDMAVVRTSLAQRITVISVLAVLLGGILINWRVTLVAVVSIISLLYFCDLLFNLYLIVRSFFQDREIRISPSEINARTNWPRYTIFCPLYRESAVVPQFVQAMANINYPHDKLEVLLLLEEDDEETLRNIQSMNLPNYFKIIIVPHSFPKTKPKACNFGLLHATGEYAVIYDAEDIPDTEQLKKAVIAFSKSDKNVGCIQAKLNYYNSDQNILTRLFTLEYSLWFNLVLTGLHSIHAIIPLGGTSNHFRIRDLQEVEGWDPFNVTEDADLGIRLAKRGMHTAILDSFTLEEANSEFKNWMKQRSRWIKGYIQTYLVHMREPQKLMKHRKDHILTMQLVVGGKTLSMLINPLLWIATLSYFLIPGTKEFIESMYLQPVFYLAVFCMVFGNFLYMYYYMLGAVKHQRPELVVYGLLIPFYWLMMSAAAFYALRELIVRPHHWHKTEHGLHLQSLEINQQSVITETP